MMMPASPWTGSTRNATVSSSIAARGASALPYGAEAVVCERIARERDDCGGAPVEVVVAHDDPSTIPRDAVALVAPLADDLDRRLDLLRTRVHRQREVLAAEAGEIAAERAELVV